MRPLVWLLRAFVFFALFAFALNNQHAVVVRWFFGVEWQAALVVVVLIAFGLGCAAGVLAMLPAWWRLRRTARQAPPVDTVSPSTTAAMPPPVDRGVPSGFGPEHPPRVGL